MEFEHVVPLRRFERRAEKHQTLWRDLRGERSEKRLGRRQVLCQHGRDDALVRRSATGAASAQRVLHSEAHPPGVSGSLEQPVGHGDRRRTDVEPGDADVGALFGGEEAQHTVPASELEYCGVLRQAPQELIPK